MKKRFGLTTMILLSLALGIVIGIILYTMPSSYVKDTVLINGIFKLFGDMFIATLKMLLVPVVFFSLIVGASSMSDVQQLGRIGIKTMSYYLITTALAISLALVVGSTINPGNGLELTAIEESEVTINETVPFIEVLINIVPTNPINAMANANMLQIIFFAVLLGITLTLVGEKALTVKRVFVELNDLFLRMVMIVMLFAPIGVFSLTAKTFAVLGYDVMIPLAKYISAVLIGLILQLVVYILILYFVGKVNPFIFLKKIMPPISIGFTTASSAAALPIFLKTAENSLGVDKKISSFTLPLGSTINMDGTAIMQGIAVIFIAQVYGITLSPMDYLLVIFTATLASIGTAAVPGSGLIMLSLVLTSVGLPIEGIALIIGIDRIVDMCRTAINLCGDAVGTIIVAKSESALNEEVYNDRSIQ